MIITAPLVICSSHNQRKIRCYYSLRSFRTTRDDSLHGGNSMKVRSLICLLLLILFASYSCTQQPEKKATSEIKSSGNVASAKKQPVKVIYLTGEIISINLKTNNLIIRGKNRDFKVFTDKETIIKTGSDNSKLSDISSGDKATVRYISIEDKNIAKSIFVALEIREEDIIEKVNAPAEPPSVIPPAEPQKVIPPVQPPILQDKQLPSS